ncbi:MAG TPA: ABC transporter permease [Gemmatimonadota bacterium]|nr:ABC transporter permease [Gemmatimonadota bacterium]
MRDAWTIFRREFRAFVRSRAYLLGTLFGPFMIALFFVLPVWFMSGGAGRHVAIVDGTGRGLGDQVSTTLREPAGIEGVAARPPRFRVDVTAVARTHGPLPDSLDDRYRARVAADSLDGFLWLPAGILDGAEARYVGKNATSFGEMGELRSALQRAVQVERLRRAGIEPGAVGSALRPVRLEVSKAEGGATAGTPDTIVVLTQFMAFVAYFLIILYGYAVARGVQEEKRDRIVEILMSSVRPRSIMTGKVFGIGSAGLLQISIWAGFAALAFAFGSELVGRLGVPPPQLPDVPLRVWGIFLAWFLIGFLLYASLYAAVGAISTSETEVQQLQFPVMLPLMIGFFMVFAVFDDPDGTVARAGSLIPFTSPIVMPIRDAVTGVPPPEVAASFALLVFTCVFSLWLGGRIYRVSILATGKRPSPRQLWRWMRAG